MTGSDAVGTTTKRGFTVWNFTSEVPFGWDVEDLAQKCEDALRYMGISQRKLNNNALGLVFRPSTYYKTNGTPNAAYGSASDIGNNFYRILIHPDVFQRNEIWNEEAVLLTLAHELVHVAQMLSGRLKIHTYSKGQRETFTDLRGRKFQYYHSEYHWVGRPSECEAEWAKFNILRDAWGMDPRDPTEMEVSMAECV